VIVRAFGRFLWDFVVGEDWVPAAGIVLLLGVAALAVHAAGVNAWWLPPGGVIALLALTVGRGMPRAPRKP
jgi:hypothetical protein